MSYYGIDARFVPIVTWPGARTLSRKQSRFNSTAGQTIALLKDELRQVRAKNVIIQLECDESQIRNDGYPRADARCGPGVIVTFEHPQHGALSYPCDTYKHWNCNLRAIALSLQALRAVDRYGVTKRGEQYTGWKALPNASAAPDLATRGRELIRKHGGEREALFATHPDHGGSADDFRAVQAARA